jgi:chromosomal replication initiator protein
VDNLWEESIKIIKEKISPQNFETWIRPLKVVSLEGNHASLSVPNKFFKDWLTENYRDVHFRRRILIGWKRLCD